jgi:tRNA dimethylallyltransferase
VIVGPTAGGKSALAVGVAKALGERLGVAGGGAGAEIVTADSIQIYRGLDIGSAKPTEAEREGIRHHLIDVVEPTERFSVDAWLELAERTIGEITGRGAVPVVVGGTHLYIKALLEGLFEGPEPDEALRAELRAMDAAARRADLERVDPRAAARIHFNDERRTVRALEVFRKTGRPISDWQTQWDSARGRTDCVLVGVEWRVEELNRRINARVKGMIERGLVPEVRGLWEAGRLGPQAREALGYKQLAEHFEGRTGLEGAIEAIKIETRRFAKNQRTWLRRLKITPGSVWVQMPEGGEGDVAQRLVDQMLRIDAARVPPGVIGSGDGGGPGKG